MHVQAPAELDARRLITLGDDIREGVRRAELDTPMRVASTSGRGECTRPT
jgi:hypothetical protein